MRIFRLPLYDHRLSSYAHSIFFCLEVSEFLKDTQPKTRCIYLDPTRSYVCRLLVQVAELKLRDVQ